jgi:hypothetical protein
MGWRFAGFEVARFSISCLVLGFVAFMGLMWQRVFNMSKTSLLLNQSR